MNNYIQDKIHQHTPIQDFESDCDPGSGTGRSREIGKNGVAC